MKELKRYVATYEYRGKIQGATFKATDEHDAKRRVKAIRKNNLRYQGEQTEKCPLKYHRQDFVWLGMKIEQMQRIVHLCAMEGERVTDFLMSPTLLDRIHDMVKTFPELMPENLVTIPAKHCYTIDDDVIGRLCVKK
jgi:hypothetical protein